MELTSDEVPAIKGLKLRLFAGEVDYDPIGKTLARSWDADHVEWTITAEDYRRKDEDPINQDPYRDRLIAEMDGQVVGFAEVTWDQVLNGPRLYRHQAHVVPEWRAAGIRRALLRWNEGRIREIARGHPPGTKKLFESWANDEENDWRSLLISEGYEPGHHSLEMVRKDLDNLPTLSLPEGIEIRPIGPADVRAVWHMEKEAMKDHRNYLGEVWDERHLQAFLRMPICDPNLWAVAWHGDRPVGAVWTYINDDENRQYGRKRGHTENIAVAREWRRQGIASALVSRSLEILRDCGMTSATLDVDAQNPSGALRVYRKLGFEVVNSFTFYQKAFE